MANLQKKDADLEQKLKMHYQHIYGDPQNVDEFWGQLAPRLGTQKKTVWWLLKLGISQQHRTTLVASKQRRSSTRLSLRNAGVFVALFALLLILVGVASASAIPILTNLFHLEPGTQHLLQTKQYTSYHQSQTVNGFTVTIEDVYADANRIIIGYTISTPVGQNPNAEFAFGLSTLTTAQGMNLPLLKGLAGGPGSSVVGNVFSFDASGIQNNPKELQLHLAIPFGNQPPASAFKITGALTFNFMVPFEPGKVVNVHQSVIADGKTVTLDRVVITSSETRLYIYGFTSQDEENGYSIAINLFVGDQKYTGDGSHQTADVWEMNFDSPLLDKHGTWTVEIRKEVSLKDPSTGTYNQVPVHGDLWAFHFIVP